MQDTKLGTVRIAPSVIATIVSLTARSVPGVAGLGQVARPSGRVLHRGNAGSAQGVSLVVRNNQITADVYILAQPEANFRDVGETIQRRVAEVVNQMVDMPVEQVNVYVEDVAD